MLFFEIILIIFILIILGGVAVSANWILDNLALFIVILVIKSALLIGRALLAEDKEPGYYAGVLGVMLFDILRSGSVLWGLSVILADMMSGSLWNFIADCFVLVVGGSLLLAAAEAPMYLVYESCDEHNMSGGIGYCIGLELLAIVLVNFVNLWIMS